MSVKSMISNQPEHQMSLLAQSVIERMGLDWKVQRASLSRLWQASESKQVCHLCLEIVPGRILHVFIPEPDAKGDPAAAWIGAIEIKMLATAAMYGLN